MKVILPDRPSWNFPTARRASTPRARSGRSSPSRPCSCARTAPCRTCACRSRTAQPIQILTTRDKDDPDALSVLRHSAAHLLAEAVRRLYPGVKVAIGPPIENGFYYDFEFPEPIREEDLERIEAEIKRELEEGRSWEREEISADEAKQRFAEENEPYKVELVDTAEGDISLYTQGDFTDLCRGPHLQNSKPIKALKLTVARRRVLARRRAQHAADADLRHGLLLAGRPRRAPRAARAGARRATTAGSGTQLDLFHFDEHSPGSPFWHPKGMAIFNALEDLRRRENRARGYVEVKTPLIYDKALWVTSGHWEKFSENMFLIPIDDEPPVRDQADELPRAHAALRQQLRSYRDLPLRYAEAAPSTATSSRARCTGSRASAT